MQYIEGNIIAGESDIRKGQCVISIDAGQYIVPGVYTLKIKRDLRNKPAPEIQAQDHQPLPSPKEMNFGLTPVETGPATQQQKPPEPPKAPPNVVVTDHGTVVVDPPPNPSNAQEVLARLRAAAQKGGNK